MFQKCQKLFTELFKPGKLNVEDRYKPTEEIQFKHFQDEQENVKRKFKSFEEVMSTSNVAKHKTYHVPPGNNCIITKNCIFWSKIAYSQKLHFTVRNCILQSKTAFTVKNCITFGK